MTRTLPNFTPTALAIAISLVTAQLQAADLPTGGNIVGGSGSISQDGNNLNVQQNSDRLITNWDNFDIGAGNTVNFCQPGSNSVALNRVIGEDASAIYGNLNANGKVFLVNPNGVLFGQGAAVNVGALVASTLSLSDEDFNNGDYQFQGDGNNAAVVNHGTLNADQGAVALLGGQVSNHGVIQANQGTVALAAGDKITLDFAGDGLLNVTVDEGTLNALVENHQLVRANGGQVIMTANATNALLQTVVNNTGIVEAQTLDNQNGTIVLKGGFNGGTVNVAGTLDASAPDNGDGGFIDTSGAHVKIADGTQVTTKANNGTTGEWLIDPTDFTVNAGNATGTDSGIGADTLSANLANNSIILQTVASGSEAGDINVQAAVTWNADTTLTLNAYNDININAAITAQGANGKVALQYGQATTDGGTADYHINAPINLQNGNNFSTQKGSTGSVISYTVVNDAAALQAMNSDLAANYAVGSNIDLGSISNWQPVGGSDRFTGTFNGLGHTLSNLTINRSSTDFVGLFGATASGSVIRDIGLVGGSVFGRNHVGGLVGVSSGTISNAYATGSVEGSGRVGGLVGFNQSGIINSVYATGSVKGSNDYVGGLVGYNQGDISNAYATGDVEGSSDSVGGLAGYNSAATISNAYATGSISGRNDVGGLLGKHRSGTINDVFATGSVEGSAAVVGGLVGSNSATISNAYATGSVKGSDDFIGGLVGSNNSATISNAYATGSVEGIDSVGGLAGYNYSATIINAYATGSVSATGSVGGLVGGNGASTISNAYATGSIEGGTLAGGLVGNNFNSSTITNSYWNIHTSGKASAVGSNSYESTNGTTGLTTAQMFDAANFTGFDFAGTWANAGDQTTPYLRALAGNRVFNKNDLPTGAIDATNRPALYTVIQNVEQLQAMREDVTANYLLGNHIDASATVSWNGGAGFVPVGDGTKRYTGSFDGLGYSINGLTIDRSGADFVGLFGATASGSVIRDIGLVGGSVSGRNLVGGLVGLNQGTIKNAYATGSVEGIVSVGGLVGDNGSLGTINNAYATGSVEGSQRVGGLVGAFYGTITQSYATGSVNGDQYNGGLVGTNSGTINQSYATGRVSDTPDSGALIGANTKIDPFTDSYWNTETSGQTSAIGFGISAAGSTGLTTAQMLQADSFAGWDIDAQGGTGTVWRIYEGYTAPLLRHFLTALEVSGANSTTTYNGTEQGGSWNATGAYDADRIFGQPIGGKNAGTYALDMNGLYSDQQGYDLITTNGTLTIDKANATVTANSGTTTYNGTEQSVDGFTVDGLVNGEDANVLTGVTTSGGKGTNAGRYTLTASGSDGNYDLTFVDGTLTINKAQATVTANSGTTTYNGTEQSVDGFTVDGLVNGEDASVLSGVTTNGGKGTNAGSYTLTASGADGNYDLTFVDGTLTINKAQATVIANSGTTTYDGAEQGGNGFTAEGLVNGETESVLSDVTISGGGRNAGSYVLTVSGADGNYDLTFVDGTLTIKRKTITADVQAQDKQFDGTPIAVLEGVLNGTISGDDVALQLSGLYASLIPGENRVLVDALLTGTDAGNYELIAPDSVSANMQGFVQNAGYQSAIVSQPHEQRTSDVPTDSGYVLTIDDDALRLTASGQ